MERKPAAEHAHTTDNKRMRSRASALDDAVLTLEVPGLGRSYGLIVKADSTRLVSTEQNTLQLLTPRGSSLSLRGTRGRGGGP